MKIGKYYWYEEKIVEHGDVSLDIGMTIPLWLEGRKNDYRRKYMIWRKKRGFKQ